MEPAKIDWKSLESVFVVDHVYENINAPQWTDFLAPDLHSPSLDDADAWFCRPDCKHPKTAEDFLKSTPNSKLLRSVSVTKFIGLGDWTRRRETNLKRRGVGQCATTADNEDSENQNPNYSTLNHLQIKSSKAAIKSSAEKPRGGSKPEAEEDECYSEISLLSEEEEGKEKRRLKDTQFQSAKDLFVGRDIFGKMTELCNELKKMASLNRAKERDEVLQPAQRSSNSPMNRKQLRLKDRPPVLGERVDKMMSERGKERKPLLQVSKDIYEAPAEKCSPKQKLRKKNQITDEAENIPISLELKDIKHKEEERLLSIRMNPPTPQVFSATRDPTKSTPSKGPKSRLMKRGVLQEVEQDGTGSMGEELGEKSHTQNASLIAGKQGRALDVLWFLKPCTL